MKSNVQGGILIMGRKYPCLEVNLSKVTHNTEVISKLCRELDITIAGVSKVYCAEKPIVEAMLKGGIELIADSRIENLVKLEEVKCKKMLLRLAMESEADLVVKHADISLNSELDTIKRLSSEAKAQNKEHGIILMVDLGDLREGVLETEVIDIAREILNLENISLLGIGTNLTCYGGVIPDEDNLGTLVKIKEQIKEQLGHELEIVSGGNSSSLYLALNGRMPKGINQLRIGEAIVLGRETAYGEDVPGCFRDCFIIKGEIVEIKYKPSVPKGKIGMDAFGKTPHFEDRGIIKRAIVALGRQDINNDGLFPLDNNIEVLGASSDHLILDITHSERDYKVGEVVEFNVDYGCLLKSMTSPYIKKVFIE